MTTNAKTITHHHLHVFSLTPGQFLSNGYFGKTPQPCFIAEQDVMWYEISLWSVQVSCLFWLCPHPTTCSPPDYSLRRQRKEQRKPSCCASTAQQYLEHHCVFNIGLVANPKHITLAAVVKKMNSISTDPCSHQKVIQTAYSTRTTVWLCESSRAQQYGINNIVSNPILSCLCRESV